MERGLETYVDKVEDQAMDLVTKGLYCVRVCGKVREFARQRTQHNLALLAVV